MAAVFPATQAIVVGGGLAGVSACNTIVENGGRVILLDKSSICGGNSTKATSGINGSNTYTQRIKGIFEAPDCFTNDTLRGGAKKPELVKVLCGNSGADVEWLMDTFGLDLSLVARLGGHSEPRTHRGKERFPGMTITYALIQMVEKVAECSDLAKIRCKARVMKLIMNNGACVGCEYEFKGQRMQEHGPVILCSGGFGADFSQDSLLAKHRPDLLHLPTTNGEHCTGDGIKMGMEIGAKTIDLEWVQVHPTGLVKPDDADAKVKFLAAEALRGVGGILIDRHGKRFANELGRRDYVTGQMWKNDAPFRLCLNSVASTEIHWHCEHYKGRGVMKVYSSGEDLAKDMGIDRNVLDQTMKEYTAVAAKNAQGVANAPYDAYGGGKTHDPWGKKFFHNLPVEISDSFSVAIVTPVIHYCMGGLEIDEHSRVLGKGMKAINGLYCAGEIAGGVHGNNRLGGNSLLDCVVFGRVAGRHCAAYMLDEIKPVSLAEVTGAGNAAAEGAAGGGAAAATVATVKTIPLSEVGNHTTKEDCWVVLHDRVINVTSFLPDHPGGELAIITFAGQDATKEFDMIHPPDVIEKYLDPSCHMGVLEGSARAAAAAAGGGGGLAAPLLGKGANDKENWSAFPHETSTSWVTAAYLMVYSFLREILTTIFSTLPWKISNDRCGVTRSAFFLILFIVIHAVGNLHIFLGPDDFNGYGYFYVRLYWTGFGLNANIVEEYVLLAAVLHIIVGLKRTWDINRSSSLESGRLNMAATGIVLLFYMMVHLFQFRFGECSPFKVRPPPYLINFSELPHLFFTTDHSIPEVEVRDIYKLEFDLFQHPGWVFYYIISVCVFTTHYVLGWEKVVPSPQLGIPRSRQGMVKIFGYLIGAFIALCYLSFPLYCLLIAPSAGINGVY